VASSNICSRSCQHDNIAAPAIVAAARRTSILAKNAAAALLLARWTLFPMAAVADAVPPPTPRLATRPPNNMLIVTSLLKPDAAALLPRQHHVCRTTPNTALTPRQYCWRCCPRRDGSVDHVVLVPSLSAGRPRRAFVRHPRPRSSGERGVIVRSAGLLLATDATDARASRDDAAADSGREVSLDLFFWDSRRTCWTRIQSAASESEYPFALIAAGLESLVTGFGSQAKPRRRGPPFWRGYQPCIPSFLKTSL
jgi:hypothetical protein